MGLMVVVWLAVPVVEVRHHPARLHSVGGPLNSDPSTNLHCREPIIKFTERESGCTQLIVFPSVSRQKARTKVNRVATLQYKPYSVISLYQSGQLMPRKSSVAHTVKGVRDLFDFNADSDGARRAVTHKRGVGKVQPDNLAGHMPVAEMACEVP